MANKNVPATKATMDAVRQRMAVASEVQRAKLIATGGNVIGTRNEKFTLGGQLIGKEFKCIVYDFGQANSFYPGAFDSNDIKPPECFALSLDGEDMAPDPSSPDAQHQQCDGCPQNVYGSADVGRGKACKNQYKLMVGPADAELANPADTYTLTLPPTSIKPWNEYVETVKAIHGLPIFGVLTTFYFDDSDLEAVSATLRADSDKVELIENPDLLVSIMDAESDVKQLLLTAPDVSSYEDKTPKGGRKKAAAKKPASKKTAAKKPTAKSGAKAPAKKAVNRSKFS